MNKFAEKWQRDKKYQAKIKLLFYGAFIIGVLIFVNLSNSSNNFSNGMQENDNLVDASNNNNQQIIKLPNNYEYIINITIDENKYQYSGIVNNNEKTIRKINNDNITNYIFENNNYYVEDNNNYIITNKEEVYDVINYNYINIDNINIYLSKAKKNNGQYLVYLKDIVLENATDSYFIIQLNNNEINIDYTPLMKIFNPGLITYKVDFYINEIEWKRWKNEAGW